MSLTFLDQVVVALGCLVLLMLRRKRGGESGKRGKPQYGSTYTKCPTCGDPHAVVRTGQGNWFLDCGRCGHHDYVIS